MIFLFDGCGQELWCDSLFRCFEMFDLDSLVYFETLIEGLCDLLIRLKKFDNFRLSHDHMMCEMTSTTCY